PSRSRQSQQSIRLTNTRNPQLGQDAVSRHALRLDSGQARNESVQRRSRIRLPRLRELLSRHARNLSKQLKLGAARINFLADTLHRERHSRAASLSLDTHRRHRRRDAKHVALSHIRLSARTRKTLRPLKNLSLGRGEVVAHANDGRTQA